MARMRMLKPEAIQHWKVGPLSDKAFRLWISMISQADDEGILLADPRRLRGIVWGYHSTVPESAVRSGLAELEKAGLVHFYEIDGQSLAFLHDWEDHQLINRPSPSKLPVRPMSFSENHGASLNPTETPNDSPRAQARSICTGSVLDLVPGSKTKSPSKTKGHPEFQRFWKAYPRKVKPERARQAWEKALREASDPGTLAEVILAAVENQKGWPEGHGLRARESKFIPHPSSWLNARSWLDEPPPGAMTTDELAAAAFAGLEEENPE